MNEKTTPAGENAIQRFDYEGSPIAFSQGDNVMVNATQMAKKFGKKVNDWLKTQQTKDFLDALTVARKIATADFQPITIVQGGTPANQGTWMHEDVAIEFARWLSPKFAIWCNDRIKELVRTGFTTATPAARQRSEDEVILEAMTMLRDKVGRQQERIETLERENAELRSTVTRRIEPLPDRQPKALAEYTGVTYTFTQVAKSLGFRNTLQFLGWAVERNIIMRNGYDGRWIATRQFRERGFFWWRTWTRVTGQDTVETRTYTVVTESGLDMFAAELAAHTEEGGEL